MKSFLQRKHEQTQQALREIDPVEFARITGGNGQLVDQLGDDSCKNGTTTPTSTITPNGDGSCCTPDCVD